MLTYVCAVLKIQCQNLLAFRLRTQLLWNLPYNVFKRAIKVHTSRKNLVVISCVMHVTSINSISTLLVDSIHFQITGVWMWFHIIGAKKYATWSIGKWRHVLRLFKSRFRWYLTYSYVFFTLRKRNFTSEIIYVIIALYRFVFIQFLFCTSHYYKSCNFICLWDFDRTMG